MRPVDNPGFIFAHAQHASGMSTGCTNDLIVASHRLAPYRHLRSFWKSCRRRVESRHLPPIHPALPFRGPSGYSSKIALRRLGGTSSPSSRSSSSTDADDPVRQLSSAASRSPPDSNRFAGSLATILRKMASSCGGTDSATSSRDGALRTIRRPPVRPTLAVRTAWLVGATTSGTMLIFIATKVGDLIPNATAVDAGALAVTGVLTGAFLTLGLTPARN